jgi:hypothetical protein
VDGVRASDLEVDEDLSFQRRAWLVQRVGWILMLLFVAAALAGVFGAGALSRARAEVPGLLSVEYERFGRFETTETVKVRVEPAATTAKTVRISIDRNFLESLRLESVMPAPSRVEVGSGRGLYVFDVVEPGAPMTVTFDFQPEKIGRSEGRVGLESASEPRYVALRRFVYP